MAFSTSVFEVAVLISDNRVVCELIVVEISFTLVSRPEISTFSAAGAGVAVAVLISARMAS